MTGTCFYNLSLLPGSQNVATLSAKGSLVVPLKEGHAATRARWSACTWTVSSAERAQRIPGLELMFKAAGHQLESKLQLYVEHHVGVPWLSVVTGPKGSYREEHVLAFLERHLDELTPGRAWRLCVLDAYAAQTGDNVKRLCWSRGYVLVVHGGGATGVTQPNDTDLHQHLRRRYTQKESAEMIRQARLQPRKTPIPTPQQCVSWMAECWADPSLHLQACKGFKYTGMSNALDGTEDGLICREAKQFWDQLNFPKVREEALADVAAEVRAGRLKWTREKIEQLVLPFPARGVLDTTLEFQDDEVVLEEGEVPWDEELDNVDGLGEDGQESEDEAVLGEDGLDDPESADEETLGAASEDVAVRLSEEDAAEAQRIHERLEIMRRAASILAEMKDPAIDVTMARAMHREASRAKRHFQADPGVVTALEKRRKAEEGEDLRKRLAVQEEMMQVAETKKIRVAAAKAKQELAKARKDLREASDAVAAENALRTFSLADLGKGHRSGGTAEHRRNRKDILHRVAQRGQFTAQQRNDWAWFAKEWDNAQAEEHGPERGEKFAGVMQALLNDLAEGATGAVGVFMANETRRVLSHLPVVRL